MKSIKVILMLSLILVSCENDNNGGNNNDNEITKNTTWSGEKIIDGKVFIRPGATLTIEAGTIVKFVVNAAVENKGAIIAMPAEGDEVSARLIAVGTANNPIVFTSNAPKGSRTYQDWGGIILAGRGFTNRTSGSGSVEGIPESEGVTYGGTNDLDDSGHLEYVRIEYCGATLSEGNEINGLTMYGVGSNTTLRYIQVYKNSDDGFEWFGGSVNAKYLVSSYNEDDSFDMDEGWNGKGQFWLAYQGATAAGPDNGFESDGRKDVSGNTGRATSPTLYNITLSGPKEENGDGSNRGWRLREDFSGELKNFVIANFYGDNMKLDKESDKSGDDTYNNFGSALDIDHVLFANNSIGDAGVHHGFASSSDSTRYLIDNIAFSNSTTPFQDRSNGDLRINSSITNLPTAASAPNDAFFSTANYLGAFDPNNTLNQSWLAGSWIRWSDSDYNY